MNFPWIIIHIEGVLLPKTQNDDISSIWFSSTRNLSSALNDFSSFSFRNTWRRFSISERDIVWFFQSERTDSTFEIVLFGFGQVFSVVP
jgi:hypothetical protein